MSVSASRCQGAIRDHRLKADDSIAWPQFELGEICTLEYGKSLPAPARSRGSVPVYGSNGVVGQHDKPLTSGPTVVIGRKGSIGKVHYSPVPCFPIDTAYFVASRGPKLYDELWLAYALQQLELAQLNEATGVPGLSRDAVYALRLTIPPLAEQERIAARLTNELELVERARAAAAQRLAAAEALPASLLREVFEGESWPIIELGAGLDRFEAGTSVVAEGRPAEDHEWGVLKVSAVSWGQFRPHENKAVPPGYVPGEHERVRSGDFLISRANTAELAGAVVLVRETPDNLMLSDKTLRLVIDRNVFTPEYLEFALRTPLARSFIEGNATGTSYSMRNISQPTIRAIPVPKPDLATQHRLAADLGEKLAAADGVIAWCRQELADIEALPAALLRAAFNGAS